VGPAGVIVVSIYVNPTQFGPKEDFSSYPRDLKRDVSLCRAAGVDVVFAPSDAEMYSREHGLGASTFVVEELLSKRMEGESRPTHFRGVTTIVAKLFHAVLPDVAVFGAKDYQQAAIIQKMVRDLNFPVQVVVAPTVREADGLALSSRNKFLSTEERSQATVLWEAICTARKAVKSVRYTFPAERLRRKIAALIESRPAARIDYIEFFNPVSLEPVSNVQKGTQLALAVYVGRTRLIDNGRL
jgi:pantoate--beta-alanine ligase